MCGIIVWILLEKYYEYRTTIFLQIAVCEILTFKLLLFEKIVYTDSKNVNKITVFGYSGHYKNKVIMSCNVVKQTLQVCLEKQALGISLLLLWVTTEPYTVLDSRLETYLVVLFSSSFSFYIIFKAYLICLKLVALQCVMKHKSRFSSLPFYGLLPR